MEEGESLCTLVMGLPKRTSWKLADKLSLARIGIAKVMQNYNSHPEVTLLAKLISAPRVVRRAIRDHQYFDSKTMEIDYFAKRLHIKSPFDRLPECVKSSICYFEQRGYGISGYAPRASQF